MTRLKNSLGFFIVAMGAKIAFVGSRLLDEDALNVLVGIIKRRVAKL